MAQSPDRPCSFPGCPNLVQGFRVFRCPEHPYERDTLNDAAYDQKRGSASQRGYDHAWKKLRDSHLSKHPLCALCLSSGRVRAAFLVDHIRELIDGGARLDPSNLQSLCSPCHSLKTKQEAARRKNKA
ncbi:HNH endonuclease signature motif containing protein [Vulgatibacter incomptus]|uniref:HNH endonuclease n=1 Tax=Vulgatibacter incomptus TaxID=1391653 RepID=UPI0009EC4A99